MIEEKKQREEKKQDTHISQRYVLLLVGKRKCIVASDIDFYGSFIFASENSLKEQLTKRIPRHFSCDREFMVVCKTEKCTNTDDFFETLFKDTFKDRIYFEEVDQVNIGNCKEVQKDLVAFEE